MELNTIISYFVIGLISVVIGMVCINLVLAKDQRDKYNSIKTAIENKIKILDFDKKYRETKDKRSSDIRNGKKHW